MFSAIKQMLPQAASNKHYITLLYKVMQLPVTTQLINTVQGSYILLSKYYHCTKVFTIVISLSMPKIYENRFSHLSVKF